VTVASQEHSSNARLAILSQINSGAMAGRRPGKVNTVNGDVGYFAPHAGSADKVFQGGQVENFDFIH
jgi:hypothetical protein